ncbi:lycopene cyclase domain-containing protein [Aestuariivivens sediminicola]|uniref:lycopene cyclase domain-containing protein n=1 Tax=Aestuariivivens sediminicola TaxID=2913560 RepID=UPI001F593347|nr:lycopene cyclase domain-containing protein [Aestuariivivens sediminicola]
MTSLYLFLNLSSLSIPFIFSFHPKLRFYKNWKSLFTGILISMLVFIPWDIIFTNHGIWGFNSDYFLGLRLFNLPIEEWLFFVCIPYACVFTHYALIHYFPNRRLSKSTTKALGTVLSIIFAVIAVFNYDKWYTVINFTVALMVLILVMIKNLELLRTYYLSFVIMLIPFFIVNGLLTGSFIKNEVVWYNNSENLNMRLFTIPVEDTVYAFTLILLTLFVMNFNRIKSS